MPTLTAQDAALLPSDEAVESYQRRGWFRAGRVFDRAVTDEALRNAKAHHSGYRDHDVELTVKKFLDWSPETGNDLRVNDYISVQNDFFAQLATAPIIGAIAARLVGADEIRVFNTSLIYKPPQVEGDAVKVGWHNDFAYWQMCTSSRMLTAWVALDDVDGAMGPLTMIDGSNTWDDEDPDIASLRHGKSFISDDIAGLEKQFQATGRELRRVPLCLRAGEVSFHANRTFHGSGVNRGTRPRVGLVIHLQDGENRHREAFNDDGERYVHSLDGVVRLDENDEPDYSDPRFCPVIWSTAAR